MDPGLQRRVQRYGWDKASSSYERFWQRQLKPAQQQLLEMAGLRSGEKALDIVCGTGLVSFDALKAVGAHGRVVGTDLSQKMIDTALMTVNQNPLSNIQFERMDAEELRFEDNSFDAAVCSLGLMYMPDPLKALREMHRVVRPGGRVVASVWGRREACGWAEIFEIVDRHVASEVCPMFFNLGNPDMLSLCFKNSGFLKIDFRRISTLLLYQDAEDALGAAFEGGPVALAYHKFNESTKQIVHKDYLDSLIAYKRKMGYEVPGEFVIVKGIVNT